MNKICTSGKRPYTSEALALDALLEAHIRFEFSMRSGPVAVYLCNECGQYHLTSQGQINSRLASALNDGTIDRLKRSRYWENKVGGKNK